MEDHPSAVAANPSEPSQLIVKKKMSVLYGQSVGGMWVNGKYLRSLAAVRPGQAGDFFGELEGFFFVFFIFIT